MGHTIFKRCPFCCKNHGTFLRISLELADGSIDESEEISLNDPFELAECYSWDGLEKLAAEVGTLQWSCGRRQASYGLTSRRLVVWDTKIDLARWLCGEALVRVPEGLPWGSLTGSGA
jgi:hypothetical protein